MNRTRSFLSVLGSLLVASPALASLPLWQNNGIFAYTMPPDAAPQIDAAAFVNYGQILLTNFFAEFSPSSVAAYPPPFETLNTVNYTNYNLIQGFPGWQFDYYNSDTDTHLRAANFVNEAKVSADNASIYGSFALWIDATNIFNRGALTVGDSGLLKLSGDNLDLVRSTVANVGADTDTTAYLQATSWSTNTNSFRFDAVLSNLPLPSGFSAYVYITSNPFSGAADVNVVYLSQTNPAISTEVRVFGEYPYGSDRAIQWKSVVTNALTGEVSTDTVYLYDYLGAFLSFAGGPPPPLVQITPNDLRWQFTPTNFVPLNYIVIRSFPGFTNGLLISPTTYDPTIFFGTNNPVLATNTAFGFDLSPTPFVPGSDVAGSDYTNEPGRIELRANNVLDLTQTRISGQSFLLLQATNHFAGSTNAHILAPFASVDLATTNGSMTVSSLVAPIIPRICGHIDVWSGHWTNGVPPDTNAATPGALLNFNVTLIDSHLVTQVQPQFEDVTLHSSNLVVADVLNVFRSLSLPDTQRLSIVTNPPGFPNLYGEINLSSPALVWASSFPRLQYLTNYGKITVPNSLDLSGHRAPPWYTTTFDEPYQSFVNNGLVTSQGQSIWVRYLQSGGTNDSGVGPLAVQADTAILTNGMLLSAQGDIRITSGYLIASNEVLRAGRGISLDCPNLSDGVSNLVNVDPATLLSATLSNANVWVAHAGFSLLAPPASGDLLGTTITNFGAQDMPVVNFSAAEDRGCSGAGFLNNAALGRMVLVGSPNAQFVFTGTGAHNALYIDYLELDGFTATNSNPSGDFTGIDVSPNMVVYFAQAMADGVTIAEKLNGRNQGRLCWVSNYNFGYFSSTEVTYADGTSNRLNAALVASCDLVSNTTNQPPVVNCNNTTAPIWPIPAPPASTNNVPQLAAVSVAPLSQAVLAGSSVTLSVVASSPAPLSYQWRKNGVAIPGALAAAYTINNVRPSDAGLYSVAIANFAGYIVSPEATLTVNMAPSILQAPHSLTVAPGGTASFTVSASGSPPLAYQWRFNDADIAGATGIAYSRVNVQAADAGLYKVVVSNPFGSIATLGATLTVGSTNNPGAGLALAPPSASLSTQNPSSNAFALAVGTYNGLFSDTNGAAPASSGSFSAKVTRGGAYTATLSLGAHSYRTSGAFNSQTRTATASLKRGALLPPLALALRLDLGGGGQMLGTVSSSNKWSAALQAYRPVPAQAGSYTVHIPRSGVSLGTAPAGDGYGILKVDGAGNVRFSGALADGTKVSQNATLSKDGYWGLYASLYAGSGCVVSWVQFNAASPGGELVWLKPPAPGAKSYPAGFTNVVSAALWSYTPAASMAGFSGGTLLYTGGGLANPLTNTFSFDAHGRVVRPAGSKLSLSFTPSSGLFSGSTRSPDLPQTLTFQGVLSQPATNGYGYFLGPQQSGQVYLDLAR